MEDFQALDPKQTEAHRKVLITIISCELAIYVGLGAFTTWMSYRFLY
jgi:hypothetical protein